MRVRGPRRHPADVDRHGNAVRLEPGHRVPDRRRHLRRRGTLQQHGHHHVDLARPGQQFGRRRVHRAEQAPRGRHVHRVDRAAVTGQQRPQFLLQGRAQLRDLQALVRQQVGELDSGTTGVGDDGDPPPARHRLAGQRPGRIKDLQAGAYPDHPGLAQRGVADGVVGGQRGRVRDRRPPPGAGAAADRRDDRLDRGSQASFCEEPPGVGDRFQEQADHPRLRVLPQVAEEFGVGDVRLVTGREHLGDSQPLVLTKRVHSHAVGPGLGDDADPAAAARCASGDRGV